jgi:hypothetical protein
VDGQRRPHAWPRGRVGRARDWPPTSTPHVPRLARLWLHGQPTHRLPYRARRALLDQLDLDGPAWRTPSAHLGDPTPLLALVGQRHLEGIVVKRLDAGYEPGRRSAAWIKTKNWRTETVVVVRHDPHRGEFVVARHGATGALALAGRVRCSPAPLAAGDQVVVRAHGRPAGILRDAHLLAA